jgi:hypothetical protein
MHNFANFNILTSRLDVEIYFEKIHFLTTSEKSRSLDFKHLLMALKCEEKGKISLVQKLPIFAILTSRKDVAGYLRQFHF